MSKNLNDIQFNAFVAYQKDLHAKNQKKIKIGIWVNIFLPLIFLILSFTISGSKLIFLILWIVSLFGIATYLIYVEFSDHEMMQKLAEFGFVKDLEEKDMALIGDIAVKRGEDIEGILDVADTKIEEIKQAADARLEEIRQGNEDIIKNEKVRAAASMAAEIIAKRTGAQVLEDDEAFAEETKIPTVGDEEDENSIFEEDDA